MMTDPIADMLARIKNATMAGKDTIVMPHSKMKEAVATILKEEGYITSVTVTGELKNKTLLLHLRYEGKQSVITGITRISKPGLRTYVKKNAIPRVVGGMGISVLSTPKGIMTGQKARELGIGGELICEVW